MRISCNSIERGTIDTMYSPSSRRCDSFWTLGDSLPTCDDRLDGLALHNARHRAREGGFHPF